MCARLCARDPTVSVVVVKCQRVRGVMVRVVVGDVGALGFSDDCEQFGGFAARTLAGSSVVFTRMTVCDQEIGEAGVREQSPAKLVVLDVTEKHGLVDQQVTDRVPRIDRRLPRSLAGIANLRSVDTKNPHTTRPRVIGPNRGFDCERVAVMRFGYERRDPRLSPGCDPVARTGSAFSTGRT